jgi:hypothetical protein
MRRRSERGSVLVLALLVTLIVLGIGLTVMWVASSGQKISGNITRRQEALYAAEAGVEYARTVLNDPANANWTNTFLTVASCGATRDYLDLTEAASYGRVLCVSGTPIQDTPLISGANTQSALASTPGGQQAVDGLKYTVWIRNDWASEGCVAASGTPSKIDCGDPGAGTYPNGTGGEAGDIALMNNDRNGRVIIRSEGIARDRTSRVTVEVIVTRPGGLTTASEYTQAGLNAQGSNSGKASVAP